MERLKFLLRLAYRDSRKNRGRLFLFMSSIILGISALVAINSFNYNLIRDIDNQSKTLLGADLRINANKALTDSLQIIVDSLPGDSAVEKELFSMAYIPKSDGSQFVRIKAIEGDFPFYGEINTEPELASEVYQSKGTVLVDDGMMLEHELEIGDSIKLGKEFFKVEGRLKSVFGSIGLGSGFAPAVYMPLAMLPQTDLVQPGSLVDYSYYYKLPPDFDTEKWEDEPGRRQAFRSESFRVTTLQDQKRNLDEAFSGLNSFLNLIALVSLILGCLGVASSVYIYIKNKIPTIAVLRCLGLKGSHAFWTYFIQVSVLGFIGVILGAIIGSGIQLVLPEVLKDILPYEVDLKISPRAVLEGVVIGSVVTALFSVVPLLGVRRISPLRTLRASVETVEGKRDFLKWFIYFLIVAVLWSFLLFLTGDRSVSTGFTVGILAGFAVLSIVAGSVMYILRRAFPSRWPFVLRQGLANLYRPNNQTRILIISIGLGTAILTILFVIQGLLISNVDSMDAGDQPNTILYGIETNQKEELARLTEDFNLPLTQQVPIVTMRLAGWQGKTKAEWMADTTRTASRWAINREARVSYRDTLESDEKLLEGSLRPMRNPSDSVFISLEEGFAEALDVGLGDELVWNVQGAMIKTYVGSLREIEFRSMRTRFFILFPEGVLEKAPQFHVLVTKAPNNTVLAEYRREVVKTFPNISVVDLGSILATLNDILTKISYVIKFMAGFSILTGLIVLISSLFLSKFQRIKESVLLRTLGAGTGQIFKIQATEYFILGALSAATGIVLAIVGSYLIARYQLELDYAFNWIPILSIFLFIVSLTVIIGLFNSREVISMSPLEILRKELS